jgi:arsenate reductase (thioredoxin)
MSKLRKVLFLCTGNSCRSQMAEALVNHFYGSEWQAYSAGVRPAGYVHPKAIQALEELGIQHDGRSKDISEMKDTVFDLVITVCDSAAEECPLWLGSGIRIHIGFPDPAQATGTEEDIMAVFQKVRDDIRDQISEFLIDYTSSDRQSGR